MNKFLVEAVMGQPESRGGGGMLQYSSPSPSAGLNINFGVVARHVDRGSRTVTIEL